MAAGVLFFGYHTFFGIFALATSLSFRDLSTPEQVLFVTFELAMILGLVMETFVLVRIWRDIVTSLRNVLRALQIHLYAFLGLVLALVSPVGSIVRFPTDYQRLVDLNRDAPVPAFLTPVVIVFVVVFQLVLVWWGILLLRGIPKVATRMIAVTVEGTPPPANV